MYTFISTEAIALKLFVLLAHNNVGTPVFTDMPSSQPIDIPDAKKRNKKKKRCRATDSFSGRFEGKKLLHPTYFIAILNTHNQILSAATCDILFSSWLN